MNPTHMNHAHMNHSMMNHTMDHSMMNHTMDHSMMNHTMDHSMMNHTMDHSMMNHTGMDHTNMDHSNMDHTGMDHSGMDHSGHDTSGGQHGMHGMHDMPGMKMYFHDGVNEYVLFKDCETKSTEALIGACFIIFAVAVLYEGLKFFRESLLQRSLIMSRSGSAYVDKQASGTSQEQMVMQMKSMSMSRRMLSGSHMIQTILHVIQVFVSYCLMLVFMTYNVWLCLAVVLGAGVGYFLFGWKRAVVVDANEHCH